MQGVNILNTTEILGKPILGYKLDIYRLVHSNHRSNFYDYNYDYGWCV